MPLHRIWIRMDGTVPNVEQNVRAVKEYMRHYKANEQPSPKIKPPILVYDVEENLIEQVKEVGKRGRFSVTDYGIIAG